MKTSSLLVLCLPLVVVAGCDQPQKRQIDKKAVITPNPLPAAKPGTAGLTGKVIETMNAAGYSYLKLATASGTRWAAVPRAKVTVGSRVTIQNAMEMKDFKSKTLDRTFPSITFGSLAAAGQANAVHGMGMGRGARSGNPHAGLSGFGAKGAKGAKAGMGAKAHRRIRATRQAFESPLAPGPGGLTIAALHARRKELKGKPVAVRGKVVKFNSGIMGRNWLHLQDGSGTAAAVDYDLTVTTKAKAKVGQVLVVKGLLATERDFGAGYAYDVIIEDATLVQ
jgi:hypothetical protein